MKKKPVPASSATENSLDKQALSLSNSGKYKEAIELYKKLLLNSDNPAWRQQLAYCYLQRALAFAAKGLYKEALVLWENYSQQTQPPYECYDHYIVWLLQTKNPARIQSCLEQLTAEQLDKEYPALAALLGLRVITDHPEFQQALPQDSVFMAHLQIVQTALQAYEESNPAGIDAALKQLPYRSAFKDFRNLIKAAIAAPTSFAEAQSMLAKIPTHSPYSQTAALLQACTLTGAALAQAMTNLNAQQRRLIGEIIGLHKKQLELIETLSQHKDRLSDKIKFNLAIQYQSLCGSELAQCCCFALLAQYPAGQRDYNKAFGSITEFEQNRLKALTCEHNHNSYDVGYYWRQGIKALSKAGTGNALKIALILRHMADNQPDPELKIQSLIESLEHDPEDRASYLQILHYLSQHPDTGDSYKQWLSKAIAKFPQDLDVLSLAIQSAMRNKAYKKANQYAQKILKVDPLNTFAKQVLFSSHLAHARKQLQDKKYSLAEKELQQAEDLKLGKSDAMQMQLLRGFFCFAAQDKKQGMQMIADALNMLNSDPVNLHFQATLEALLTGQPVATILRDLPPAKEHVLSKQALIRFIELLKQYAQESGNEEYLHKALEKVKAPLKKSVLQQNYDESLLLSLCQTLDSLQHFELLRHCAKWARDQWPKPIWVYYKIYSETNGEPEQCSFMQSLSLQTNLEQARQDKDHRAMALIGDYLKRYHEARPLLGMGFLENLFDMDEDDTEDPFEKLFGHLPDELFFKINKRIESLAKKTSPERLVQELGKVIGHHNRHILFAIMQDPDLFTALMIVRAADELGIRIDVSVEDVLACFGVENKTNSFPF